MYSAKIICDSISETGKILTTFELEFIDDISQPTILEQILSYRMFSRNYIRRNNEGFTKIKMLLTTTEFDNFFKNECNSKYEIKRIADLMYDVYHTNFNYNNVPNHPAYGKIKQLKVGEWHLPYINFESESDDWKWIDAYIRSDVVNKEARLKNYSLRFIETAKKISVARCARVSYLTHDGKRDIERDLELFEKLRTSGHWSPFEHVATPKFEYLKARLAEDAKRSMFGVGKSSRGMGDVGWDENKTWIDYRSGNFIGWKQFRKEFQDENCTYFRKD